MPTGRVLLIGLDSADAELIERWSDAGHLPALAGLREEGSWSRIGTTASALHVSAWPTLHTGTRPGVHGLYHAYQIRAGEQDVHRTAASEIALAPFWKHLDQAGVRCIVVDAFMNAPVAGFGGLEVLEYGTWTWFDQPRSTPPGLWKEIEARFGAYPAPEHTKVHGRPEPRRFRDALVAGAGVKGELGRWLMREQPWDFLFFNFAEPHPAGHYLWHLQDRDYPLHPAGAAGGPPGPPDSIGLGEAVLDVYRAVDAAIGRLLGELDGGDTVIVTSGDGMGPNYSGCHLVPEALHRLGLYHASDVGRAGGERERPRPGVAASLRGLIPPGLRRAVSRCLPPGMQHQLSMKWVNAGIDWQRSRAFCIPNANEAFVRLNLAGREPRGIVERGAERALLLERLGAELAALSNPATGLAGAEEVLKVQELFAGPRHDDLPDLVVTWNARARVQGELESPACGRIALQAGHATAPFYSGNHRPAAFALARGPGVRPGAALASGHLVDVAPTVAALLGREPAAHWEGRPWSELAGEHLTSPTSPPGNGGLA
jgi:predicted AlkP superfamily phosphohydrolase/phosphomutase